MNERRIRTEESIHCSVLREADYRPGAWLLSDRCPTLSLFPEDTPLLALVPPELWPGLPYLVLVREQRTDGPPALHAKPLAQGTFAFGGNWLWSTDPAFPADHPIPIHDAPEAGHRP